MIDALLKSIGDALQLNEVMPRTVADLTLADFSRWKPLVERMAMAQQAHAETVAAEITQLAEHMGDQACVALAHWIHANVLYLLDQPAAAIPYYDAAESIYVLRAEPLQMARLRIGKVGVLAQLGQYDAALEQGQTAVAILKTSATEADQNRLAALHDQLGVVSEFLGRYLESLDGYQQKYTHWQARLKAIDADTETHEARIGAEIELARASANIGVAKTRLGQFVEAHAAFQMARRSLTEIAQREDDETVWSDIARVDMNLAWLEMLRRSPAEQIHAAFVAAQDSRTKAGSTGTDLIFLDLLEATWQLSQTKTTFDEAYLLALRARCEASGLAYETARANLLLGDWLLRQGYTARAQGLFEQILHAALQRGDVEISHQAGLGLSRALQQVGHITQAIQVLGQTLDQVESIRHQIVISDFRAGFLEDKLALYQELARLHLVQHAPILALQAVERAKARTLADLLAERQSPTAMAPSDAQPTADLVAALQRARAELDQAQQGAADERQRLEGRITDLVREMERHTYSAPVSSDVPLVLDTVCAALPRDTLIVAYAVLQGQVWVFLMDHAGLRVDPICLGDAPDELTLRQQLARVTAVGGLPTRTAQRWVGQHIGAAQMPLGAWYRQFVAPLRDHLKHYVRVVISPDGLLHHLPYACLWDAANGQYLIEQHEVLVTPSLRAFGLWNAGETLPRLPNAQAGASLVVGYSSGGRLSHAVEEAQQVAALIQQSWPTEAIHLLLEAEATYERVAALSGEVGLMYIATHGLFRADAPQFSYLELANGQLSALDILRLHIKQAIVVLSACETGLGRLTGNEMVGMVQAFLFAGARTVVATHWQVNDQATGHLMAMFAKNLLAENRAGAALAQAQRCLIQGSDQTNTNPLWAHPYYWGGIWLVGVG